jgi:hypothetical protein
LFLWIFDVVALAFDSNTTEMWLPPELARHVGSYLDPLDLTVCTQLCFSGAEFVSAGFTNDATTVILHELVACCRSSAGFGDVAHACIGRIELFVKRRRSVQTIILDAQLKRKHAANATVYSDIHHCLLLGSWFDFSQNQGITVEWHVTAESIAQVEFLLFSDVPMDGARVRDSPAGGALRQYLHTLALFGTPVSDISVLALCQSLHTLDLSDTQVSDVTTLASCQSLHTLNLCRTPVSDISVLALCQSLDTLNIACTPVSDVTALAACKSLHALDLSQTNVRNVSVLAPCQSLHTLDLWRTRVSDVSALGSCQSLHTLNLRDTPVSDVSALVSCLSLRQLPGVEGMIGAEAVLWIIQNRG